MRTCSKCLLSKEETEFYTKDKKKKTLQVYCKPCFSKIFMLRWKLLKERAISYKGGSCEDCKGVFLPEVYQFHHMVPHEKSYDWNTIKTLSWDKMVMELDKCALLCSNCHILRHSKHKDTYL